MKIAFIIDPIQRLDPTHDTSVALIEAAQALGHEVWITQAQMLSVVKSKLGLFLAGGIDTCETGGRALGCC